MERPTWALPGRKLVYVTLKDGTRRIGQLLTERGDKVNVEYLSPAGHFQCRLLNRSQIEVIETPTPVEVPQPSRQPRRGPPARLQPHLCRSLRR